MTLWQTRRYSRDRSCYLNFVRSLRRLSKILIMSQSLVNVLFLKKVHQKVEDLIDSYSVFYFKNWYKMISFQCWVSFGLLTSFPFIFLRAIMFLYEFWRILRIYASHCRVFEFGRSWCVWVQMCDSNATKLDSVISILFILVFIFSPNLLSASLSIYHQLQKAFLLTSLSN